jgi:hypothetical protein
MATWPETLPQNLRQESLQWSDPDLLLVFQPDFGPPITRKRGTANMAPLQGEMIITAAQKAILKDFWKASCASLIDFPDPDGGAALSVKFLAAPQYQPAGGGNWRVTLKFGVMP